MSLSYGFMRSFGDDDAVLFLVDREGAEHFFAFLSQWAAGERESESLDERNGFRPMTPERLILRRSGGTANEVAYFSDLVPMVVEWRLSRDSVYQCLELMSGILREHRGHVYAENAGPA